MEARGGPGAAQSGPELEGAGVRGSTRGVWRKVLYARQEGFADNYVDRSFLESLVGNVTGPGSPVGGGAVRPLEPSASVLSVASQLSVTCLFHVVFFLLFSGHFGVRELLSGSVVLLVLVWGALWAAGQQWERWRLVVPPLWPLSGLSALILSLLFLVSPVLQTLTASYSSDTIFALAAMLSALHLALHDYRPTAPPSSGHLLDPPRSLRFLSVISLNAACVAAVLLASRLSSPAQCFALIVVALECFALFPILRARIEHASPPALLPLTAALSAITFSATLALHTLLAALFLAAVAFVTVAGPMWFQFSAIRYKREIHGPWDIAKVGHAKVVA